MHLPTSSRALDGGAAIIVSGGAGLAIVAAVLIMFGIWFRLYHLQYKVLSDDETISIMHGLGLTEAEIVSRAATYRTAADLRAILHPTTEPSSFGGVISSLRMEDPQHPPAYYLLERCWFLAFGDSLRSARTLPAIIGVATLPCMFWLCLELFGSVAAAVTGTMLFAVSPINVLYAQEVREYSLWVLTLIVTTAIFVRALRSGSRRCWTFYAAALAICLYIHPESAFVALAHAVVVLLARGATSNRLFGLAAIVAGSLAFLPWIVVILAGRHQIEHVWSTVYLAKNSPRTVALNLIHLCRLSVLDFNGRMRHLDQIATIPIFAIVAYAVLTLRAGTNRTLIWSLIICTTLPVIIPDLLWGGQRTSTFRYFMPLFFVIDLALTALLCLKVIESSERTRARNAWLVCFALLLAGRAWSIEMSARAHTWWTKYDMRSIAVARSINRSSHPVVFSDDYIEWVLSVGEYLDPSVDLALSPRCYMCTLPSASKIDLSVFTRFSRNRSVWVLGSSTTLQRTVSAAVDRLHYTYQCIDIRHNCDGPISLF